ncbi:AAA family ATPase [Roseibium sp.]|uniref:AAA family ATPase n=1 Tax=Roseibium sp. TaxID=1936156 RepID=UPI003266F24B
MQRGQAPDKDGPAISHLISFSGLPGVGKSTIATALCRRLPAILLRVDAVEAALKRSMLRLDAPEDAGYQAIAAIAAGNLALGHSVVADTVNPVEASRRLWAETARSSAATLVNVEVVCTDADLHRSRVEARTGDIAGLTLPTWQQVVDRHYEPWSEPCLRLDSAALSTQEAVDAILRHISVLDTDG